MSKLDMRTGTWDAKCGLCRWYRLGKHVATAGLCSLKARAPSDAYPHTYKVFAEEVCGYFNPREEA